MIAHLIERAWCTVRSWMDGIPAIIALIMILMFAVCQKSSHAQNRLMKKDLQDIVRLVGNQRYPSFDSFLKDLETRASNKIVQHTAEKYRSHRLDGNDTINVYRLLGVFVRTQYQEQMVDLLKDLIRFRTDSLPGIPQFENPNILRLGRVIETTAQSFGLAFRNVDNRVFEVILKGSGNAGDSFGIYTHADVVPADKKDWVLDDGTPLDPYEMRIIGDRMYGRGTEDDKASIVSALFAMKAIRESGLSVNKDIRLIIETTEEIGGSGFTYYKSKFDVPEFNVVLDNLYPVVTAEKGFLLVLADFEIRKAAGSGVQVIGLTGGTGITSIPAISTARLRTPNATDVKQKIDGMVPAFVQTHGGNFKIESSVQDDSTIAVNIYGVSAHSSVPETGVNPIPLACVFLHTMMQQLAFRSDHFTDAIRYVVDNYGLDLYGKKMGIDYADDFMGPLTVTVTTVTLSENALQIGVSGRPPRGKDVNDLKQEVEYKLADYQNKKGIPFGTTVKVWDYMYRNPQGRWINTLLNIFGDVTGMESKPVSSNGGTTAKLLPNAVSFGPGMPGEKYMGHTTNEFRTISNFLLDAQMFTEMMLRIGNLDRMTD